MTKNKVLLFATSGVLAIGVLASVASLKSGFSYADLTCDHDGYHYDAVEADCVTPGSKEFWACCKCHHQFTTQPTAGNWAEAGAFVGTLDSTHVAYEAPNDNHHFDYDGVCKDCSETIKDAFDLDEGGITSTTISEITGFTNPLNVKDLAGSHFFGAYDFANKNGLEFVFNIKHDADGSGEHYTVFYFGNQYNEDGLKVRIDTDRTDKYRFVRFASTDSNSELVQDWYTNTQALFKTTTTPGSDGTLCKIKFTLTDKATEKYHVDIDLSNDGGSTWANKWIKTEGGTAFTGIDYTFGANYFSSTHNLIRVSGASTSSILTDAIYNSAVVSYANDAGTAFGHKQFTIGDELVLPNISRTGYNFVGWFDQAGKQYKKGDVAAIGQYKLVARFTKALANSYNPSDAIIQTGEYAFTSCKDSWYESATLPADEGHSVSYFDGSYANFEEINFYMLFDLDQHAGDYYAAFLSFPFDTVNARSRVFWRLNAGSAPANTSGYVYNGYANTDANPRGAGSTGTYFTTPLANKGPYLLHWNVKDGEVAQKADLTWEITTLSNGQTYTYTNTFDFGSDPNTVNFTVKNRAVSMLRFVKDGNTTFRFKDAF